MQQREKRAQDFQNKMADNVLKNQEEMQRVQEMKIKNYEMEKEMRDRMADIQRAEKKKHDQRAMKEFLFRQHEDKKRREAAEKALNDEQAVMWREDKVNYEEEERRLQEKIKNINLENASFLKGQAVQKHSKGAKMNRQEYLLNKDILRNINNKNKSSSQMGDSVQNGGH